MSCVADVALGKLNVNDNECKGSVCDSVAPTRIMSAGWPYSTSCIDTPQSYHTSLEAEGGSWGAGPGRSAPPASVSLGMSEAAAGHVPANCSVSESVSPCRSLAAARACPSH